VVEGQLLYLGSFGKVVGGGAQKAVGGNFIRLGVWRMNESGCQERFIRKGVGCIKRHIGGKLQPCVIPGEVPDYQRRVHGERGGKHPER